jgi:phage terminase small subunit
MTLTDKQAQFVQEYLIDLNATQAAIRAGYSEETAQQQGSRLLLNVVVGKAVADAMAQRSVRTRVTADRVLTELARIGFGDIRSVVAWRANTSETGKEDEDGVPETRAFNEVELIGSAEIDHDAAAAIAEISQGKDGALKIKMHNKVSALQEIGRHLGIASRTEVSGPDGKPIQHEVAEMSDIELARRIAFTLESAAEAAK